MIIESIRLFGRRKKRYLCSVEVVISDGPLRFCLRGIRLIDLGKGPPHMAMPAWKKESDNGPIFEDMFFPMTQPSREFLERDVLAQYYAYATGRKPVNR